ncbi:uncharacterized protein Z519_00216 [Cladophialophora bantiana CBS 173.52]|uniref:Cupin type-2 domain-containing protein n=1 Tax=Cladophialophora bantiana (strain ATCC 10958 / CBS 173.52 / CDC B-1940 / NIH 8579) TaxID=1442370 RepID=A0A0D2I5N8_CLAB1|nr:uncharacterized protein Z519_00216 [Cladophialophora bantiana CBS 173.52]KIW98555.1 hypothetical protein Z519_00216 [Cladophialophora bantiana CBS 173.52]
MASLPDPRRIVTDYGDEATKLGASVGVRWETKQFPADNSGTEDQVTARTTDLANRNGVILRVVDVEPGTTQAKMLFHRTGSLDFGILFSGEVSCYLDDSARVDMKPGDVCVQWGTIHGWTNTGTTPARLCFCLVAAKPANVGDRELGAHGYYKEDIESGGT